jgi:cytochrome P450
LQQPVGYLVATAVYNVFFHPLRKYPGPKLWAMSRLPWSVNYMTGRFHKIALELHKKYGDVVRIAPNELSLVHPDAWREVMGHRKAGEPEYGKAKSAFMRIPDSVINAGRDSHAQMRRLVAHAFSAQSMLAQEPIIKGYVDKLVNKIRNEADTGRPVNMELWFNYATFDIMGDLAFGESFGCLDSGRMHSWVELVFDNVKFNTLEMVLETTGMHFIIDLAQKFASKELLSKVNDFVMLNESAVDKRIESESDRKDFLYYLLRKNGDYVSRDAHSSLTVIMCLC